MPELIAGQAVPISRYVYRVLAPNPGPMTGPGTNTYLVGDKQLAVIDPGPANSDHIDALLSAAESLGGRIDKIIVTHTHGDHSPGAQPLKEATSAPLYGLPIADDGFQDTRFKPDIELSHDECIALDPAGEITLRVIHTPGHVNNHLCFLQEQDKVLFTGDHLMSGSTVVIIPPAGDMAAYINSLQLLQDYDISLMAPGHGDVMNDPQTVIKKTIDHRLNREQKVLSALRRHSPATVEILLPDAYDDTPEHLYRWAALSLEAHLIKLARENRAAQSGEYWQIC